MRKIQSDQNPSSKRKIGRRALRVSGRAVRTAVRAGGSSVAAGARHSRHIAKRAHHHLAVRPHQHLTNKIDWYHRWHEWRWHKTVHYATLGSYILVIGVMIFNASRFAFAADLTNTWDFTTSSGYTIDSGLETSGTSVRLKAQNYANDANTSALYHLDETTGSSVSDSSSNSNTGTTSGSPSWGTGNLNNGLALNGTNQFVSAPDSASLSLTGQHSLEAWTKFGTNFDVNSSQNQTILDKGNYKLYYDHTSGRINYEVANSNANTWNRAAGNDTSGSWSADGQTYVRTQVASGSNIYAGLGAGTGDAEVWRWNGTAWTKIGGDGLNGSWADNNFEDVHALAINGNTLYAGIGTNAAGDGEVWSCDISASCNDWTKIGGDGLNSGWAVNLHESVLALSVIGSNLYAGTGSSPNDAEVWRWNGSTWTLIGGDSVNSGWTTNFESVRALDNDGTNLYAAIGDSTTDAEVWRWNGSTWTKIGGDGANSSWNTSYEMVMSLSYFGGNLYAGLGTTADDAEVWRWNGSSWTKIGGDAVNSSWAASTYEGVYSLVNDGTNLYAGTGSSAGDGEVWRWNGSSWTKIGGDAVNSGFSANQAYAITSLLYSGSTLYVGTYSNSYDGTVWTWNGSSWTRIGGGLTNKSWGFLNLQSVESATTHNGKLYVGTGTTLAGNAQVWEYDGSTWNPIGGQGINSSWAPDAYENVYTLQSFGNSLYVGIGTTANDAEVWRYNGSTWTQVGGDNLNGSWNIGYEGVYSLGIYNGALIAGLGASAQDAEVYSYNGSSWTKIGGDGVNSSWTTGNNIEAVYALTIYNGELYAGLGASTGDGDVWRYNGTAWSQVGGDGLNSGWAAATVEEVYIMRVYNNKLYAGTGNTTGDGDLWEYNGSTWTQVGGDDINSSWTNGTYERVRSLAVYNGELYAGVGDTTGEGEVWRWSGGSWSQIGGDSINGGFTNVTETVNTLIDYQGKLYAGTGNTQNADAAVWTIGNNAFLQSAQTSQDTNWHHVAATYNGSTMKIYIDGSENASAAASVTMGDGSLPLLVGSGYGSRSQGVGQGFFNGTIDEVRVSNIARTGFTTKPYTTAAQTVSLTDAVRTSGVLGWESFAANETVNGGSLNYRLSDDDGSTWKYWTGSAWATSTSLTESNPVSVTNTNIATFPVGFGGITWQAILQGNGDQRVTLNSVTLEANSDAVEPATNASNILGFKSNGGASLASNGWTNGSSPYFSWTAGSDAGSGIKGYCLYLGTDNTADPVTTKGLLGTSPVNTGGHCQFAVGSTNLDLATAGYLGTALTTSNSSYYLRIKALDNAGNVHSAGTAQFQFRFDNTAPANPGFITSPSGFINTKTASLTWPTSGGQAPADSNSGLAGLQYKINNTTWYGDSHSGSGDINDLLANDGSYTTTDPPDFANINEGVNTVYFRTWDQAGNVTSTTVSAALKVNTSGAPSEPLNVVATPTTNTTNSFAFSWDEPATYVGDANNLSYCYTINTVPSSGSCTFTSSGVTSLGAGPYATQPGSNTFYVVARDESSNINYASYASTTFSANTPSPGIPTNVDIVDVSIKNTSNWRLALTWEPPTNVGAGVSSYKVYRSTDNNNFSSVGASSSTTYIDAGLSQQTYYYRVRACDSTNNCGADSTTVNMLPTGKFTSPAALTAEPKSSDVTTKKAKITWSTDRGSDSKIAIGTSSGQYSPSEVGNSSQVTSHTIELDNLAAGTTYYYRAKWTDEDGNTGTSQEYTFRTAPAPLLKEVTTSKTTLSSGEIQFTSNGASRVNIYYGRTDAFGGLKSVNTSPQESTYNIELGGLEDGTKYFYKLSTFDSEGNEYQGNIFSFSTLPRPKISNVRFQPETGEPTSTQKITWLSNVPTTSLIRYTLSGGGTQEVVKSELQTEHEITIRGLVDDSTYTIEVQGRDGSGNLANADIQTIKTAQDTRPPVIKDVTTEVSIKGTGAEARGQAVVAWKTDEPSSSQVAFAEGSDAVVFNNKTPVDDKLTTEHLVIVSDLPTSKAFSFKPLSKDKAHNEGSGEVQSVIVGKASDSVLTIILNTLQRMFGF